MKKFLISVGVMLVGMTLLQAEQLSFVTLMSAPVGSFAQVETKGTASVENLDLHKSAVTLKGTQSAKLGKVTLGNSTLGGDVTQFKTDTLNLAKNGTIKGGSLIADTLTINQNTNAIISNTLSSDATITTMAAKTRRLNINNGDSTITGHSDIDAVFNWETNTNTPGDAYEGNKDVKLLKGHENEPIKCLVLRSDCEEITSHCSSTRRCKWGDAGLFTGMKCGVSLEYGADLSKYYSCDGMVQPIPVENCTLGGKCEDCTPGVIYIDTNVNALGCGKEEVFSATANWWIHKATYTCVEHYSRNSTCPSSTVASEDSCGEVTKAHCGTLHGW